MTTYHEPPLQSRRAARESERAERPPLPVVDPAISVSSFVTPPSPRSEAPAQPVPQSRAAARAQQAEQKQAEQDAAQRQAEQRYAAQRQAEQRHTEQRPAEQRYSERRQAAAPQPTEPAEPWAPAARTHDPLAPAAFAAQPPRPAAFAPVERPSVEAPRASDVDPIEHTLTRRELRALREQQGAEAPSQQPQLGDRTASYAELDALVADRRSAAAPPPVAAPPPLIEPPTPHGRRAAHDAPAVEPPRAPVTPAAAPSFEPAASAAPPAAPAPWIPAAPAASAAPVRAAESVQPAAPAQPAAVPEPAAHEVIEPTIERTLPAPTPLADPTNSRDVATASPQVGHWSTQAERDDSEQSAAAGGGRGVGGYSPLTTSALILPPAMDSGLGGALSETGEIFITGSVQLPRSYASHGAYPDQLESADLDHLLDPSDYQVTMTDSQPVRAMRAVSTHTATGTVMATQRPPSNRGLTILIIAAASMAALVGTIFVVAVASGQL